MSMDEVFQSNKLETGSDLSLEGYQLEYAAEIVWGIQLGTLRQISNGFLALHRRKRAQKER